MPDQDILSILTKPTNIKWQAPLILAFEAILCSLIIWKVPYTEIDWTTYMQQVSLFLSGERDYTLLKGDTGPLVYPAGHLYIYSGLYYITDEGRNIKLAQWVFMILYLITLAVVMQCYRVAKAPPYLLPLLVLSKRLHSIFLLRLFNDCFVVLAFFLSIYCFQLRQWKIGSQIFSLGIGIKMSLVLALPAAGVILLQAVGFAVALNLLFLMLKLQFVLSIPFLYRNWWGYLTRSFELTRVFLYKWTVNYRFVPESVFYAPGFSILLLQTHVFLLAIFLTSCWLALPQLATALRLKPWDQLGFYISDDVSDKPDTKPPFMFKLRRQIAGCMDPQFVLTTMLSAMAIGMLCARSLHYQFFAYIAWATPFLLWRAKLHPVLIYAVWGAQEWAWNVYPSTSASSLVVVSCLAVQVLGVLWGTRGSFEVAPTENGEGNGGKKHNE